MSIPISILYKLPESIEALLAAGSWLFLEHMELTSIGEIPVRVVEFESTKRNLDPSNSRSSSGSLSLGKLVSTVDFPLARNPGVRRFTQTGLTNCGCAGQPKSRNDMEVRNRLNGAEWAKATVAAPGEECNTAART